jgi:flagellar biosynthetic protein FlhB
MAEAENGQERTEQASGKKQSEAREKGQVARSKELSTVLVLLAGGGGFLFLGDDLVAGLMQAMRDGLVIDRASMFDDTAMQRLFGEAVVAALWNVMPFFAVLVIAAVAAPLAMGGWSFSLHPLQPDLKKMDPIKGLKRVFSWKGLVELVKALAKFCLVGSVGYLLLEAKLEGFLTLGEQSLEQGIAGLGNDLIWIFFLLSSTLIVVALVDVPFQLWDFARQQKMTRQEVKDEHKETDGSPEVKGKIRRMQLEMAQRRMMEEVPKADVVVTNPTHYAVALRYDQDKMGAPVVVALGADEVAGHIRRIALANGVPILSAPPLARALYFSTKLNEEIPAGLYLAVAQVLAYIFQLRNYTQAGGAAPKLNPDLPIPDDLRRDK